MKKRYFTFDGDMEDILACLGQPFVKKINCTIFTRKSTNQNSPEKFKATITGYEYTDTWRCTFIVIRLGENGRPSKGYLVKYNVQNAEGVCEELKEMNTPLLVVKK